MSGAYIDLRGFVYGLAAQLDKHRWELERLQARAAKAGLRVDQLEVHRKGVEKKCHEQYAYLAGSMQNRPDPAVYGCAIVYFIRQRNYMEVLDQDIQTARNEQKDVQERCIAQQRRIQLFEEHRAAQLQEFVSSEQTRMASELDREWSARSLWRAAKTGSVGES